jgi:hypothetical protein
MVSLLSAHAADDHSLPTLLSSSAVRNITGSCEEVSVQKDETQVMMTSSYNENSCAQSAGGIDTAEKIKLCVDLLRKSAPDKDTFTIAEFGCAGGGNSVGAISTMLEAVTDVAQHLFVFMNDREQNDWDVLRHTIQTSFSAELNSGRMSLQTCPGSMYSSLPSIPSKSVDIAFTNYALNWLSCVPSTFPEGVYIHDLPMSSEHAKLWADAQHADLHNFLKERSRELASGGFLVLGIQAREESGRAGWQGLSTMGEVKNIMLQEGILPLGARMLVDPERNRSMSETLSAVDKHIWHVISVHEKWVACPFVESLRNFDESLAECAMKSMNLYRACTEHFLSAQLGELDPAERSAIVEEFYERTRVAMASDPTGQKLSTAHPYHYVVLQRA